MCVKKRPDRSKLRERGFVWLIIEGAVTHGLEVWQLDLFTLYLQSGNRETLLLVVHYLPPVDIVQGPNPGNGTVHF